MGREAGRVQGLSWDVSPGGLAAGFLPTMLSLLPPRPSHRWPSRRTAAPSSSSVTALTLRVSRMSPLRKPTIPCASLLCFMVSSASITSSEDHLSECPSTCPHVPPNMGSIRAGTAGGCQLERKWWTLAPQAGLRRLCPRADPRPSWTEF